MASQAREQTALNNLRDEARFARRLAHFSSFMIDVFVYANESGVGPYESEGSIKSNENGLVTSALSTLAPEDKGQTLFLRKRVEYPFGDPGDTTTGVELLEGTFLDVVRDTLKPTVLGGVRRVNHEGQLFTPAGDIHTERTLGDLIVLMNSVLLLSGVEPYEYTPPVSA